jgi:hypothetical protein
MLFELTESLYNIDNTGGQRVEGIAASIYLERGYNAIHHDFYLFHQSAKTRYPENEALLNNIIGQDKLASLRRIAKTLYPERLGKGLRPEQPDLFVYKGAGDYFFSEVKSRTDHLRAPQMIGISLIHCFLGVRTELCTILTDTSGGSAKTYRWVWPGIQELGFGGVVIE